MTVDDQQMMTGIRLMRGLSALIEVTAVIFLFRMTSLSSMTRLNGLLGLVGPLIFITVMALGIAGQFGRISPIKLGLIFVGVVLILWGTRS